MLSRTGDSICSRMSGTKLCLSMGKSGASRASSRLKPCISLNQQLNHLMGSWLLLGLIDNPSGLDRSIGSSGLLVMSVILVVGVEQFCCFFAPLAWMLVVTVMAAATLFRDANFVVVTKAEQFSPRKKTVKQAGG